MNTLNGSLSAGIILNAMVCTIVAGVALAFFLFLWRRRSHLSPALHAYTFIWLSTVVVWTAVAIRYYVIGFALDGQILKINEFIVEVAVFFTAPPLYYYLGFRIFNSRKIAKIMKVIAIIGALVSCWFLAQPNGISAPVITPFSAEPVLNNVSVVIFSTLAGVGALLLAYDVLTRLRTWKSPTFSMADTLYSGSILVYVIFGSVDQLKVVFDWPILALHILYCAVFLFGYMLVSQEEARHEQYLVTKEFSRTESVK